MGRPTIFLTLTCNIHWADIEDQLLDGQTAYGDIKTSIYIFCMRIFLS